MKRLIEMLMKSGFGSLFSLSQLCRLKFAHSDYHHFLFGLCARWAIWTCYVCVRVCCCQRGINGLIWMPKTNLHLGRFHRAIKQCHIRYVCVFDTHKRIKVLFKEHQLLLNTVTSVSIGAIGQTLHQQRQYTHAHLLVCSTLSLSCCRIVINIWIND